MTSSALAQSPFAGDGTRGAVRLDTSYVHDDPRALTRLMLGDTVSRGTDWIRPVRFAGVQFGSDFGLQPNFISFPSPSFAGQATLPSVIQAYVNDAVRYTGNVPQGPFDIQGVPVVTGAGEVRFVVQDAMGVQRNIRGSYYVSPNLLRAGLNDYSLEAGFLRRGYGIESFSYDEPFASATYRRGLTDFLTGTAHVEGSRRLQLGSAGLALVVSPLGEFDLAGAASRSGGRGGLLGFAAFTHLGRWWSVGSSVQATTRDYLQIGAEQPDEQIRNQVQAFGSISLGEFGAFSTSFTQIDSGDGTRSQIASMNYDVPIAGDAYLNAYALASRTTGGANATAFGLQIVFPLGGRDSATAAVNSTNARLSGRAEFRRDPPFGTGLGYRATFAPGEPNSADAQFTWRNEASTITAEAADAQGRAAARVIVGGSVAYAAGKAFAARELGEAFGVASVSGYPGVRVYQENQLIGRTDGDGRIALPELRAYQENHIRIDSDDVPLDADVSRDAQSLVPALHGAAVADFAVKATRGAIILLVTADGAPLPPGIPIAVDGRQDAAFTGYDGQTFVDQAHEGSRLEAIWDNHHCVATVGRLPAGKTQPHLGPLTCEPAR